MNAQEFRTLYLQNCVADAIEALLAVLDALEPDPDLEPDLGDPQCGDREADYLSPTGGTSDDEPSIGHDDREHDPAEMGIADKDALAEWRGEVL